MFLWERVYRLALTQRARRAFTPPSPSPAFPPLTTFSMKHGSNIAVCSPCGYCQLAWPLQRRLGLQDDGAIARLQCGAVEAATRSLPHDV